ncbi:MAG: peptidylprolyl isomerase [Chloroflexota bacterium]
MQNRFHVTLPMTLSIFMLRLMLLTGVLLSLGFRQAAETVATVNDDPISVTAFQQRVRFARWATAQQLSQIVQTYGEKALTDPSSPYNTQYKLLADLPSFGKQVLDSLITVKLVQQEAARRGISVTDDEVQQQINLFFGYTPDATPVPAAPGQPPLNPTEVADSFQANRDNYFGQAGVTAHMTQADVLATFAEQALQIKLYQALTGDLPAQVEQVKVRHILMGAEDAANGLLAQIKGGANFAELAKANSLDSTSAALGGDLGWSSKGTYVAELDQAIWTAKPGDVLGPIKTKFGFHLVLVEGREMRVLTPADLARAREALYQQLIVQIHASAKIQIVDNWQSFIPEEPTLKDLGLPEIK